MIVQAVDPMVSTNEVIDEVGDDDETPDLPRDPISSGAARTIASWWAAPRDVGSILARFSQGQAVDADALDADIVATIGLGIDETDRKDLRALHEWIADQRLLDRICGESRYGSPPCQEEREGDLPYCPGHMAGLTREDLEA